MRFFSYVFIFVSSTVFATDKQEELLDIFQAGQLIANVDTFIEGPNFQSSPLSCSGLEKGESKGVKLEACIVPLEGKSTLSKTEIFIKKVDGDNQELKKIANNFNLKIDEKSIYFTGVGFTNDSNMFYFRPMKEEGDDFGQTHEMKFNFGAINPNRIRWTLDGGTKLVSKKIDPKKYYSKNREELDFDSFTFYGQNGEVYQLVNFAKVISKPSKSIGQSIPPRIITMTEAQYKGPDGKIYGESELRGKEGVSYGPIYKNKDGKIFTNDQLINIPEMEEGSTVQQFATQQDYLNLIFDNKEKGENFYWKAGVGLVAYRSDDFGKIGAKSQQKITHRAVDDDEYGIPHTIGDGQDSKYGFRVHLGGGVQNKFLEREIQLFGTTIKCDIEVDADIASQFSTLDGDSTLSLSAGAKLNLNLPKDYRLSLGIRDQGTKYGILQDGDKEDMYHTRRYRLTLSSPSWDVSLFKTKPQSGYENPPMFAPLIDETTEEIVWGIEIQKFFSDRKFN